MDKIKNIKYNNEYIEIESSDKYIYKIPNNNSYIRSLLYKGINSNKELNNDIKFCDKCADICVYPICVALGCLAYGFITNFLVLDLLMILCGGMSAIALTGVTVFKLISNNIKTKANNNEYFTKIYEYAINGGKIDNKKQNNVKQTNKSIDSSKKTAIIQNTNQKNNNLYNLPQGDIIQNEETHQRKR